MARTGQYILDGAWIMAQDAGQPLYGDAIGATPGIRWSSTEGLRWLNDTQIEIVGLLPKANAVRALVTPVAGTRQTFAGLGIGATGIAVVDIPCNFSLADARGSAMTKRDRVWLDEHRPGWHSDTAAEADHWMYDPEDPKAFFIHPAIAGAAGKLELIHSAVPADLSAPTEYISLDDIYALPLMYGVMAKFYAKDGTYGKNPQMAAGYMQLMMQALGLRGTALTAQATASTARAQGVA